MNTRIVIILLTFLSPMVYGQEQPRTAQQFVEEWLSLIDAGEYETTWQSTAPIFQSKIGSKKWAKMAKSVRKPLGKFNSRKLLGAIYKSDIPRAPIGDYVIFQYESKFSKNGGAIETVTPMLVEGRWKISGYYIR